MLKRKLFAGLWHFAQGTFGLRWDMTLGRALRSIVRKRISR